MISAWASLNGGGATLFDRSSSMAGFIKLISGGTVDDSELEPLCLFIGLYDRTTRQSYDVKDKASHSLK